MDNLEPITRNEMLLNGDDLEPITREEMILAGADLEPITRHEWFLKKYRGGGGGGGYDLVNVPNLPADIASFNNGTDLPMASLKVAVTPYQDLHGYDGPWAGGSGKNKANVSNGSTTSSGTIGEVVLPQGTYTYSIYMKRNDDGICRAIVSIDGNQENGTTVSGTSLTRSTLTFTINETKTVSVGVQFLASYDTIVYERVQVESGSTATSYAPYSNICPIIGWDEVNVTVADDAESPTTSHEYTIDLDGTRYGGTLDATNGVLTVDRVMVDIGSMTYGEYGSTSDCTQYYTTALDSLAKPNSQVISDIFVYGETVTPWTMRITSGEQGRTYFRTTKDLYESPSAFKTAMNGHQLVYELATPITVQLAPTAVKSIEGVNKIFANCGQITEVKYFKKA